MTIPMTSSVIPSVLLFMFFSISAKKAISKPLHTNGINEELNLRMRINFHTVDEKFPSLESEEKVLKN